MQGVRSNQLIGYGLVVGLDGTGDQTHADAVHDAEPDRDAAADGRHACRPARNMQLKNVAAVMVTAQLPAFAQPGPDASTSPSRRSATPRACAAAR